MKSVVITGVSSGIGYAAAKLLLEKGMHVFGSVRSKSDADKLKQELGKNFTPLLFDVTDEAAVHQAARDVKQTLMGETLFGLVNNAGIAVVGPLLHMKPKDFQHQLDVNLTGQLIVTQAFTPLLGSDPHLIGKPGRIINIGSVSGKIASPFNGAYAISKHGLEAFSDSLRRELMIYGIDVILVAPGPVSTPILEKGLKSDLSPLEQTDYAPYLPKIKNYMIKRWKNALPVESIAEAIYEALTKENPAVRSALLNQKWLYWTLPRLLPKRWIDKIIFNQLGMKRKR